MNPSSGEPTFTRAEGDAALEAEAPALPAERVLREGEVILLAVKPSGWFVLLSSLRVLAVAAVAASTALLLERFARLPALWTDWILFGCSLVASLQLILSGFRWLSRLYVLTNLRILRISGLLRSEVYSCPLGRIDDVQVLCFYGERLLRLGSVVFLIDGRFRHEPGWVHLNDPMEVAAEVRKALRKMGKPCEDE